MQSYIMNGLHVYKVTLCWLLGQLLILQQVLDRLLVLPEVDPARTVEPAKSVAVPGRDLGEFVDPAGLVEPAPLVEGGMVAATPNYGRLDVFLATRLSGPAGAFGSSTGPLRLRGIVEIY